jgi:hypothetical protein
MRFIAHVTLRQGEDAKTTTVENEFESSNWQTAWQKMQEIAERFGGTIVKHRLAAVNEGGKLVNAEATIRDTPLASPLALPSPPPAGGKRDTALVASGAARVWAPAKIEPMPWPASLSLDV